MFRDKLPNIRLDPVIKHNAKKGCSISAPYHISSQSFLPLRIVSGSERRKETVQAAGHQSSHITHTHISKQDTTPHISHTHTHIKEIIRALMKELARTLYHRTCMYISITMLKLFYALHILVY